MAVLQEDESERYQSKVPADDWLQVTTPAAASRARHKALLEKPMEDEFLSLGLAMRKKGDIIQECLFNKFYLFMRDCLPDGLTGEYGHIRGDDVMNLLLSHKETTPSRHKMARQAESAFVRLEAWMAKGKTWRDAQRCAREEADKRKLLGPRKRSSSLAPGLHPPAGILALFIIAHPDDAKFKTWVVQRLQSTWMLRQAWATLDVKDGFWRGVNNTNLHDVFAFEEDRQPELPLLADYTRLFGAGFKNARKDISPYLPGWTKALGPLKSPPGEDSASARGSDRGAPVDPPTFSEADILALRRCLDAPPITDKERSLALELWLFERLAAEQGPDGPLPAWCQYWEDRMDKAAGYQQQQIVQSLFLQSLSRLEKFYAASIASVASVAASQHDEDPNFTAPLHKLYMVVDMNDGRTQPLADEALAQQTLDILRVVPAYHALDTANTELGHLIRARPCGQVVLDGLQAVAKLQLNALRHTTTLSPFADYFFGVLAFEALRTLSLTRSLGSSPPAGMDEGGQSSNDVLLGVEVAATLQLTRWQLQLLLVPGVDKNLVLTDCQSRFFRERMREGHTGASSLDSAPPVPLRCRDIPGYPCSDEVRRLREKHRTLCELFGTIQTPDSATSASNEKSMTPSQGDTPMTSQHDAESRRPSQETISVPERSLRRQSSSLRNESMTPVIRNAFGELNIPAKRPAGPEEARQAKIPRRGMLGGLDELRNDLTEELRAHREWWQNECRAERERRSDELRETREQGRRLEKQLTDGLASLEARWRPALDRLRSNVDTLKSGLGLIQASLRELGTWRVEAAARQQEADLKLEASQRQLHEAIQSSSGLLSSLDARVTADMSEVKSVLAPAPPFLESGRLAQECPAPVGKDQKAYEAHLFRACMAYMCVLWDPLDPDSRGVVRDVYALEETKKRFPDLNETAIVKALEHFHLQLFNSELGEREAEGTGDQGLLYPDDGLDGLTW